MRLIFGAPHPQNQVSDFSKRQCTLCNARRRTSGPSLSLPGCFWPILRPRQDRSKHEIYGGGHLWGTTTPKQNIRFQHTQVRLVQCAWKGDWAKFGHVWMILAGSSAVARQAKTPIFSKSGARKSACLDLTSGPHHLQRTGKHVVKSDLAQPVPYTRGTS